MIRLIIKTLGLAKDFADAREWLGKRWFLSKTLWVNLVALIALWVQSQTQFVIGAEEQTAVIIVINMILRLITKQPLVIREQDIVHVGEKVDGNNT